MEKKTYTGLEWLEAATRSIRFVPDRRAVRAELYAHLEDKTFDLMRIFPDLTEKEALAMALERMGDPEEIGQELGRIHKPWLGYLWQASRVVLIAVLCLMVLTVVRGFWSYRYADAVSEQIEDWQERDQTAAIDRVLYADGDPADVDVAWWKGEERLAPYEVEEHQRLGNADVSLTEAALWRTEEGNELWIRVSVEYDWPWQKSAIFANYLVGEDSLGNRYGYELITHETGAHKKGFATMGGSESLTGYVWNLCLKPLPEEAEWVRLTYALRPASGFAWFIPLKEVGGP